MDAGTKNELWAADDDIRQVIVDLEVARYENRELAPALSQWLLERCGKLEEAYRIIRRELARRSDGGIR